MVTCAASRKFLSVQAATAPSIPELAQPFVAPQLLHELERMRWYVTALHIGAHIRCHFRPPVMPLHSVLCSMVSVTSGMRISDLWSNGTTWDSLELSSMWWPSGPQTSMWTSSKRSALLLSESGNGNLCCLEHMQPSQTGFCSCWCLKSAAGTKMPSSMLFFFSFSNLS